MKKEKTTIVVAGVLIGVISAMLVFFGNPANMGFCIACFLRDTTGALGLHSAAAVQYIRPEIIGLVLGACIVSLITKEFRPRGGSAPVTRFTLGAFVMIGCLMFLGCPFRMILRLAGGDGNAIFGLVGFAAGILTGTFFLKKGYTLKRSYKMPKLEGAVYPAFQIVVLILLVAAPAFIHFTEPEGGPGCNSCQCADYECGTWIFPSGICRTADCTHRWTVECAWHVSGRVWLHSSWRLSDASADSVRRRKYRFCCYSTWSDGRSCFCT